VKFNLQFLKIITKLALPCWSKKNLKICYAVSFFEEVLLPLGSDLKPF
jgi:hypothetical protein